MKYWLRQMVVYLVAIALIPVGIFFFHKKPPGWMEKR